MPAERRTWMRSARSLGCPNEDSLDRKRETATPRYTRLHRADSSAYARRMVDRLTARSRRIGQTPLMGAVVVEYESPDIREVLEPPYRIIYRVKADRVDILAVIHGHGFCRAVWSLDRASATASLSANLAVAGGKLASVYSRR